MPINITIGGRGHWGGLWVSNQNSSGGDTIITFNETTIIGHGGWEGTDGYRGLRSGGAYYGGDGGAWGGDSQTWGCGGACA